jgi:hypothetical protein
MLQTEGNMTAPPTPALTAAALQQAWTAGMDYAAYRALCETVVAQGRTTGPKQTPELADYTRLNLQRMKRLETQFPLTDAVTRAAQAVASPQHWLVLTEAWCGDAAQSVSVMARIAALNPRISLRYILRDEHLNVMDAYLTNGGRSIPKLIVLNEHFAELGTWGPRPTALQQLVLQWKAGAATTGRDWHADVQRWYNQDKTQSLQAEFTALLGQWTQGE